MKTDFLIFGRMANNDIMWANRLSKMGFEVMIYRSKQQMADLDTSLIDHLGMARNYFKEYKSKIEFLKDCYRSKVIISLSCSLQYFLGKAIPLISFPFFPPIISCTTGSDIAELPLENTKEGFAARYLYKHSFIIYTEPGWYFSRGIKKMKLGNIMFAHRPFITNLDINKKIKKRSVGKEIVFLSLSNIDFGINDPGKNRYSTKGNDKFIKAFINASKKVDNIKCIIAERGPDVEHAKKIIFDSGCENFTWIKETNQSDIWSLLDQGDVIVDQFDLGTLGGIAMEAISYKKPVLIYCDPLYLAGLFYNDIPPILNVRTTDEIYEAIIKIAEDPLLVEKIGEQSYNWLIRHYNHRLAFIDLLTALDAKFGYNFTERLSKF